MSSPHYEQFNKRFKRFLDEPETNTNYETYQNLKGLIKRYSNKFKNDEIVKSCFDVAQLFEDKEEYSIMFEILIDFISIYTSCENQLDDSIIEKIIQKFEVCNDKYLPDPNLKFVCMSKVLNSTISNEFPFGNLKIHSAMAKAYFLEKQYGNCQNHLVFCDKPLELVELIKHWQENVYPSEKHILVLRLVLILLSLGKIRTSLEFLKNLPYNYQSESLPTPIQLGYLLSQACYHSDLNFYEKILNKFQILLKRDSAFGQLISTIDEKIMCKTNNKNNILSTLTSMMGI